MMPRLLAYAHKVFGFAEKAFALTDSRKKPQIPTSAVFMSAFVMCATRLESLNALEQLLRHSKRLQRIIGKRTPSADTIGAVADRMDPEELRQFLAKINHKVKRNKNLNDNPWALRFVALDGHEFFSSRKRKCDGCCSREVTVKGEKVTEYYHRGVVAHLIGFDLPIVLDIEMVNRGENEQAAARRLLSRLLNLYGRFFDAVCGDAIYWEAPMAKACREKKKHLLAVLKNNNPSVLGEACKRFQRPPDQKTRDNGRDVEYWDDEHFTAAAIPVPFRVVHSREYWTRNEIIAGERVLTPMEASWFWVTTIPAQVAPPRQIAQAGHKRWCIENRIFNALGMHWALDHCYRHAPNAILNFILILFIAFTILQCFYCLNIKPCRRKGMTFIELPRQLLASLPTLRIKDVPWRKLLKHRPPPLPVSN
jgi:hypothetical protein